MSTPFVQARLALLLVLGACTGSETYGFVAVLGNDTTSVERVTRTGHRIIGDAIGRSPTVTRRHWEAELGPNGVIAHWSMDTDIPNGSGSSACGAVDGDPDRVSREGELAKSAVADVRRAVFFHCRLIRPRSAGTKGAAE